MSAETCEIFGYLLNALGEPLSDSTCLFLLNTSPALSDGMAISSGYVDSTSDDNGLFSINLIQGVSYKAIIDDINLHMAFTVPDSSSQDLFELLGF